MRALGEGIGQRCQRRHVGEAGYEEGTIGSFGGYDREVALLIESRHGLDGLLDMADLVEACFPSQSNTWRP